MAEAALFSLTVKILATIATPAFKKGYERVLAIWEATKELEQLSRTIQTIQASLRDAERRESDSFQVKDWMERTKDVLYEADDLFDAVATTELLKQQKGNGIFKKVRDPLSKLISNDSSANKVKAIRKSLRQISVDMGPFQFEAREYETSMNNIMRRGVPTGWHVEQKHVFGRDEDKKAIKGLLLDEKNAEKTGLVIALVGTGGMGKSTLAQLVYNDQDIIKKFTKRRWSWVSKTFDVMEITGKIFQSVTGECYNNLDMSQLQSGITESIAIKERFLLILDDLWDDDHDRGRSLRSLLSGDIAEGSKILITTRYEQVAKAMEADATYFINGLSPVASWKLFKSLAFIPGSKKGREFKDCGKRIVRKCADVPLAINSIASLLYTMRDIRDWQQIEREELSRIEVKDDSIMSALKLSYDHLEPHLKQCFAYCYLFPKDHIFCKDDLIYLWIAQGYVKQKNYETIEVAGDACFMELLERSFFQEAKQDKHVDEIVSCKMHSLMHDLAQRVAGEECIVLTEASREFHSSKFRHLSVGYETDSSWNIPQPLLRCSGLRSSLFKCEGSLSSLLLDELPIKFKYLRALNLGHQKIEKVSSSIGELKHLRYLNLSGNKFTNLPSTMTKLVNLHTLDISSCDQLEALPVDFRRLISLMHLDNRKCHRLRHMPPRFGELPSLRRLSYFKVGKAVTGGKCSRLDAFAGLELIGELMIRFDDGIDDWNGATCWQLPSAIQVLAIKNYPEVRMPHWGQAPVNTASSLCSLVKLQVSDSSAIKILPPFRLLPNLKALELSGLDQLVYVEEEENVGRQDAAAIVETPTTSFDSLRCLEELQLCNLPNLVGWSMEVRVATISNDLASMKKKNSFSKRHPHHMPSFASLLDLKIQQCQKLKYMPLSPRLQALELDVIDEDLMQKLLSSTTPSLKTAVIRASKRLKEFPGESLTSLRFLELKYCNELQHLSLQGSMLEELMIQYCPKLVLWGEGKSVDWDSLPNLRVLSLDEIPDGNILPNCLRDLQSNGTLEIRKPQ